MLLGEFLSCSFCRTGDRWQLVPNYTKYDCIIHVNQLMYCVL